MVFKDYYKILNLDTNKVTSQEIKNAFREQAKKYHPDINNQSHQYEERFKDINEAYRVLSESSSKRKYDRMWNSKVGRRKNKVEYEESKREKGSAFSEFFNMFFGENETKIIRENKNIPEKGENIETEINVKLEDAYYGLEKKISLRTVKGQMRTFSVKVPAGIRNGEKIRLIGQGKPGVNGGKNGDLFIRINIENNKKFKLHGCDILTNIYVSPWEAALGKKINIESIEENITLDIPAGIQSGEQIVIPHKGYKDGQGGRGDLIANVKTVVPKELTEEEKELFEKLKQVSNFNPRS